MYPLDHPSRLCLLQDLVYHDECLLEPMLLSSPSICENLFDMQQPANHVSK